jgi:hypothetical protein
MAKAFANSPLYDAMKKNPATILALKDAAQAAMKKGTSQDPLFLAVGKCLSGLSCW